MKHMHGSIINICSSKKNLSNSENHNVGIRQRNNLYLPQANLTVYQKQAYSGIKNLKFL